MLAIHDPIASSVEFEVRSSAESGGRGGGPGEVRVVSESVSLVCGYSQGGTHNLFICSIYSVPGREEQEREAENSADIDMR
jgi:hypothetical protein